MTKELEEALLKFLNDGEKFVDLKRRCRLNGICALEQEFAELDKKSVESNNQSADASPTALEWDDVNWDGLRSEIHASLKKFEIDKFTGTPIELLHCLVVDVIQSFASVKGCLDVEAEKSSNAQNNSPS